MSITDILFWFFAAMTLGGALAMALSRNTVNGALCMIVSLASVGGLFVLLEAWFLAVLQILVYAGAVMVLFLFIIMLLDVKTEARRWPGLLPLLAAAGALALLAAAVNALFLSGSGVPSPELQPALPLPGPESNPLEFATSPKAFGYGLFTRWLLPLEMMGVLLLSAIVGVLTLSRRAKSSATSCCSTGACANAPLNEGGEVQ